VDELLSESALMIVAGGSPGVTKWTMGVLVAVAVFSKVAVGWITATVAAGGSVAVFTGALVAALLGVTPGVALVKLHARMEVIKTATPNQVVN
jgi:Ca2+/H+ antiporter